MAPSRGLFIYATISLEPRVSCLCHCLCHGQLSSAMPSNATYLGHRQLRQYQFYNNHSLCLNRINSCYISSPRASTTTLCVFYGEPYMLYRFWYSDFLSIIYTSTCRLAERAAWCLYIVIYVACGSLTTTSRVTPVCPKCLALH